MLVLALLGALATVSRSQYQKKDFSDPDGDLQRVVVLARHGNRAPNSQVPYLCPAGQNIIDRFEEPTNSHTRAALSRVGKAENWESGKFLRYAYKKQLYGSVDKEYRDSHDFYAFSERMNRNIVSMQALLKGFWQDGTGEPGFLETRPNLVPIKTSQPMLDTLINLPRDGPCRKRFKEDTKAWDKTNTKLFWQEHGHVLDAFGRQCGFDFRHIEKTLHKPLAWGLKAASDLFSFAKNEGIDITDGGRFNETLINEVIKIGHNMTNLQRFGEQHQVTYWIGDFVTDALFDNLEDPGKNAAKHIFKAQGEDLNSKWPWKDTPNQYWNRVKMLTFMNHREIFTAIAKVFGYNSLLSHPLPSGSMIIWELYKNKTIVTKSWAPSTPSWKEKHSVLDGNNSVLSFFNLGHVSELRSTACGGSHLCSLSQMKKAYADWIAETGTWQEICHLKKKGNGVHSEALWDGVDLDAYFDDADAEGDETLLLAGLRDLRGLRSPDNNEVFAHAWIWPGTLLALFCSLILMLLSVRLGMLLERRSSRGGGGGGGAGGGAGYYLLL